MLAPIALRSTHAAGVVVAFLVWQNALAGDLRARVVDLHGKPLADAVVTAKPSSAESSVRAKPSEGIVEQVDKEFVPRVKTIVAGSSVSFPNHDKVRHQVYSFSRARKFELPLYSGAAPAPSVMFATPGVVVLGCNIHDWMLGYIYVSDTPFFATTGQDGTALIKDLPAGDYNIRVWQPSMGEPEESTTRHITIGASGLSASEWHIAIKPAFRPRRAPSPGAGSYH